MGCNPTAINFHKFCSSVRNPKQDFSLPRDATVVPSQKESHVNFGMIRTHFERGKVLCVRCRKKSHAAGLEPATVAACQNEHHGWQQRCLLFWQGASIAASNLAAWFIFFFQNTETARIKVHIIVLNTIGGVRISLLLKLNCERLINFDCLTFSTFYTLHWLYMKNGFQFLKRCSLAHAHRQRQTQTRASHSQA